MRDQRDLPSMKLVDDKMQAGYAALNKGDTLQACRVWLETWHAILDIIDRAELDSLDEFDDRFGGTQSVFNWVQDLETELHNAGLEEPRFFHERISLCQTMLERFPDGTLPIDSFKAALAALVISAVLILFHPRQVFVLWKQNRNDGVVAVTVFVLALVTKPDYALLIGVMISLILFLWKTMHPRIVRETRDPERELFVNADLFRKPSCPQILHLRSDNVIYFANAEYTINHIMKRVNEVETPLQFVLLDFQAISFIDMTGIEELRSLKEELESRGIRLALMAIHRPVMDTFESSGFVHDLRNSCYFEKTWDNEHRGSAIAALFEHLDQDYCRESCPHRLFEQCDTVK